MESQLQRPYGQTYDDCQNTGLHSVVEDEGEHHHEKKSVLKKVKDKAKKIKDTLKKHGHGHEHEHDQERDYHHDERDEDEEDEDEDEEMFEDPEIHGAPIYESAAVRSAVPGQGMNLEKPAAIGEDRYGTKSSDQVVGMQGQQQYSGQPGTNLGRPTATEVAHEPDKNVSFPPGQSKTNFGRPTGTEVARASEDRNVSYPSGKSGTNLGRPTATEVAHAPEDKNVSFPLDIYGSRVSHPSVTGGKGENMQRQGAKIGVLDDLQEDPSYARPGAIPPSNYETKVTDPTGKGGEEAEVTPLIRSLDKMSVSDESVPKPEAKWEQSGYTGSHDQFAPQSYPTADEFTPKPLTTSGGQGGHESTAKSYDPSEPGQMPRDTLRGKSSDQSGYIEKISTATSVIADKAMSAKNVVASKLGYGGTEGAKGQEIGEGKEATKSTSPTEYAHKVAATVTEKLAPVYEKVADAGSSVVSKVKGTTSTAGEVERPEISNEAEGKVADKGVSVKEYLAEKFKPSDEDKALSEVISETLHKKKEELGKTAQSKPLGKVTESDEVARHLGSGKENQREGEDARAAGSESTGTGVMDRIKGAVSSWVGKGSQEQDSQGQGSPGSCVSDESSATGEVRHPQSVTGDQRRLQESVN